MKLWEALELLDKGYKIRRPVWAKRDYLYKEDDKIKRSLSSTFVLELDGLSYEDWEVQDDRKEIPKELEFLKVFYKSGIEDECYFNIEGHCLECPLYNQSSNSYCSEITKIAMKLADTWQIDK